MVPRHIVSSSAAVAGDVVVDDEDCGASLSLFSTCKVLPHVFSHTTSLLPVGRFWLLRMYWLLFYIYIGVGMRIFPGNIYIYIYSPLIFAPVGVFFVCLALVS